MENENLIYRILPGDICGIGYWWMLLRKSWFDSSIRIDNSVDVTQFFRLVKYDMECVLRFVTRCPIIFPWIQNIFLVLLKKIKVKIFILLIYLYIDTVLRSFYWLNEYFTLKTVSRKIIFIRINQGNTKVIGMSNLHVTRDLT